MQEIRKEKIPHYTMKMRIYPSKAQAEQIDKILHALHVAYNMTFHEVFEHNPAVCTEPKEDGSFWPDFNKMAKAPWRHYLIEQNPTVEDAPFDSTGNKQGMFLLDAKKAWEKGMNKLPVNKANRKDFHFYCSAKPRNSFLVQIDSNKIVPAPENPKVVWLTIKRIKGRIKARGFNRKIWFGKDGLHTFEEAVSSGETANKFTLRVSKDRCGDYFVSLTLSEGNKHEYEIFRETQYVSEKTPLGVDMGIKDLAILSDGTKIENKRFKKKKKKTLKSLNRKLSRRWGPANLSFRDYNKSIRSENKTLPDEQKLPLAQASHRYLETKQRKARIERKIARRRDTYSHQQTAGIVSCASKLATETLRVKNMMRNHKRADALGDAAIGDFLSKLKYKAKADRNGVELLTIGVFEPSSQLCNCCNFQNPEVKNSSVREWTCPQCGAFHDRDINAAKNILHIALSERGIPDKKNETKDAPPRNKGKPRKPRDNIIFEDKPDLVIRYSKELTGLNNPRYVIIDKQTNRIIDDAQGFGYRSVSNARNCYRARIKHSTRKNTD